MVRNLSQAKTVWRRMSHILSREGVKPRVKGLFFKAVIQVVLLFGAETWVVTPRMVTTPGGVQTQVARRLTVELPRRTTEGTWKYNSATAAREAAGFLTMEEYVRRLQNTVTQYISTRSLLDMCEGSERDPGARVRMRWREQEVIYLSGEREAAVAVVEEEGVEEWRGEEIKTPGLGK